MINSQQFFKFVSDNNQLIKKEDNSVLCGMVFSGVFMSVSKDGLHNLTVMSHNFTGNIRSK